MGQVPTPKELTADGSTEGNHGGTGGKWEAGRRKSEDYVIESNGCYQGKSNLQKTSCNRCLLRKEACLHCILV